MQAGGSVLIALSFLKGRNGVGDANESGLREKAIFVGFFTKSLFSTLWS